MSLQRFCLAFAFVILQLHVFNTVSLACKCMPPASPEIAFEKAPAVFTARMIKITPINELRLTVTLEVLKAYKGVTAKVVEVETNSSSAACGFTFFKDETYLLYAETHPDTKRLTVSICSRSRPVRDAEEDLAYLERQQNPSPNDCPQTASILLKKEWNLISLPLQPSNTSAQNVLRSIEGKYSVLYSYDSQAQRYETFRPGSLMRFNLVAGRGYWIYMKEDSKLDVCGSVPSTDIKLNAGWNLVGYNSGKSMPSTLALASIEGKYAAVFGYNPDTKSYEGNRPPDKNLYTMEPGRGYWIYARQNGLVWKIPSDSPNPSEAFILKYGQTIQYEDLRITFRSLIEDSRCPKDVTCVWAGNGAINLELVKGKDSETVKVNTTESMGNEAKFHGYRITLLDLLPYPDSKIKVNPEDYSAKLKVIKGNTGE